MRGRRPFSVRPEVWLRQVVRIAGRWYQWATNPRRRPHMRRVGWRLVLAVAGAAGIAFVQQVGGASTINAQTSFSSTAATFTQGNLLVAMVGWSYSTAAATTIDVPAGWTAPIAAKNNGAPNGISRAYYMANNPGGSQSWTWNLTPGSATAISWAYTIFEFSGADQTAPLDLTAISNATGGASSTSLDTLAATGTTQSGGLLVHLTAVDRGAPGTLTTDTTNSVPTSGWTVGSAFVSTGGVVNCQASGQYNVLPGTQASPRGVLTSTVTESSESFLLTFIPAPSAPSAGPGLFTSVGHPGPR